MKRFACFLFKKRLVSYLYGEATARQEQLVKAHLKTCPFCRKIWEEMKTVSEATKPAFEPETPAAFWEFYPKRVMAKISEEKVSKRSYTERKFKKILVLSSSALVFLVVILGSTRFYLVEKEIKKNHELYQNLEVVWNLDLINQVIEDEVFAPELLKQTTGSETLPHSKKEIHLRVHRFRRLPASERNLIIDNYQQWADYPASKKKTNQVVYYLLKVAGHPDLKELIFE